MQACRTASIGSPATSAAVRNCNRLNYELPRNRTTQVGPHCQVCRFNRLGAVELRVFATALADRGKVDKFGSRMARQRVLIDRVEAILDAVREAPDAVLVGSSYGGLAALAAVQELGPTSRRRALVLLAPALMWREAPVEDPSKLDVPISLPCVVFHGRDDDVAPLSVSDALALGAVMSTCVRASLPTIVAFVLGFARYKRSHSQSLVKHAN